MGVVESLLALGRIYLIPLTPGSEGANLESRPYVPQDPSGIQQISTGRDHALCVTGSGHLLSYGAGDRGQLGQGYHAYQEYWQSWHLRGVGSQIHVNLPVSVTQVACGNQITVLLTNQQQIFSFGRNDRGQTGHQVDSVDCVFPRPLPLPMIPPSEPVLQVACGSSFGLAMTKTGLLAWGCHGLAGEDDSTESTTAPQWIYHSVRSSCQAVAAGTRHIVILLSNRDVLSAGSNTYGQLGRPGQPENKFTPIPRLHGLPIQQISCGEFHTAAVTKYQELYTWGRADSQQLGVWMRDTKTVHEPFLVARHVRSVHCGPRSTTYCSMNNILYHCSSHAPFSCIRQATGLLPYAIAYFPENGRDFLFVYSISLPLQRHMLHQWTTNQLTEGLEKEVCLMTEDRAEVFVSASFVALRSPYFRTLFHGLCRGRGGKPFSRPWRLMVPTTQSTLLVMIGFLYTGFIALDDLTDELVVLGSFLGVHLPRQSHALAWGPCEGNELPFTTRRATTQFVLDIKARHSVASELPGLFDEVLVGSLRFPVHRWVLHQSAFYRSLYKYHPSCSPRQWSFEWAEEDTRTSTIRAGHAGVVRAVHHLFWLPYPQVVRAFQAHPTATGWELIQFLLMDQDFFQGLSQL